jgi:hypothetical protein
MSTCRLRERLLNLRVLLQSNAILLPFYALSDRSFHRPYWYTLALKVVRSCCDKTVEGVCSQRQPACLSQPARPTENLRYQYSFQHPTLLEGVKAPPQWALEASLQKANCVIFIKLVEVFGRTAVFLQRLGVITAIHALHTSMFLKYFLTLYQTPALGSGPDRATLPLRKGAKLDPALSREPMPKPESSD